jgi:hypothetical protein
LWEHCSHQLIADLARKPKRLWHRECFNSRPLTDAEKAELWQLPRADAPANVKEKHGYDPSK